MKARRIADSLLLLFLAALPVGSYLFMDLVPGNSAHVATDSSDRSVLVNTNQIESTPIPGRDLMGLLQTLPGVVDLNPHDSRGYNAGMPTINGGQSEKLNVSLDGIKSQDSGNTSYSGNFSPSTDAIAEVRVMIPVTLRNTEVAPAAR